MNYLDKFLDFDTIEQGEKFLAEAKSIRDKMGGELYWSIANDDFMEISAKLSTLKFYKHKIKLTLDSIDFKIIESYVRKKKLLNLDDKLAELENDLIAFELSFISTEFEKLDNIDIKDIEEFINNKRISNKK